jgi:hypothetical protein
LRDYSRFFTVFILMPLCFLLITACNNKKDAASQAIEAYLYALSNKDAIQISNLSCAAWEQDARLEIDSLTAVGSKVENLACEQTGEDSSAAYISCTGSIVLDYNGEAQQIDLSLRTYIARQEDGEWRMCGYR